MISTWVRSLAVKLLAPEFFEVTSSRGFDSLRAHILKQ